VPELPEVETIRRQSEARLAGKTIVCIEQKRFGIFHGKEEDLVGKKILGVRRFGKLLVFDFSNKFSLAIHLKMTGRLTLLEIGQRLPSHTHVIFSLDDGHRLTYSDSRRFGFAHLMLTAQIPKLPFLMKLGKEPLKDLTLAHFSQILSKTKRAIKTLLLDQTKIAGIGNIYACESLWIAKISPERPANSLEPSERKKLFDAIESVLRQGIRRGGASDNSYRNLLGGKGEYQNFFKVYAQVGKPCSRCGTKLKRIVQAGRSTFFCPKCQGV